MNIITLLLMCVSSLCSAQMVGIVGSLYQQKPTNEPFKETFSSDVYAGLVISYQLELTPNKSFESTIQAILTGQPGYYASFGLLHCIHGGRVKISIKTDLTSSSRYLPVDIFTGMRFKFINNDKIHLLIDIGSQLISIFKEREGYLFTNWKFIYVF